MDSRSNSQEEEILLTDYSRNVSFKSSALFYGNALIVSAVPIWLYWKIFYLDLNDSVFLFTIMTLLSTYLVSFAYKNCKFYFKHEIAQKREEPIRKDINTNSKLSRKEKDDLILSKKNEVSEYEATTYSIFYNNLIFLILVVLASTLFFKRLSPSFNYVFTMFGSSGLIALLSTGSQKSKK